MAIGLGLNLSLGSQGNPPQPPLCQAIAAKRIVTAMDGDMALKLAPHVVYRRTRREIETLEAVVIERNGKPFNQTNLRSYRVADLSSIVVTDENFTVSPDFDPDEPEYAGRTICIVQTV